MNKIENLIHILAIGMGAITLLASTASALLLSRRAKGRSSGKLASFRSGLGVLIITIVFVGIGFVLWKPILIDAFIWFLFNLTIFGAVFYFCGVGLYLWGLGTMRSQFGVSSLLGAELYKEHKLVTSGPFGLVRHPLYVGVILTAIGALLIFRTWAMVLFTPMSLVVIGRAGREEKLLAEEFGEEWKAYVSKVPMWIPRLW
jgi:protein-S-isoprenylcysteine O-methyltransferase Ste14